jgi:hypothetical protein
MQMLRKELSLASIKHSTSIVLSGFSLQWRTKETLINWLHERITSLRGTHAFTYLVDRSQLLRSGRLVLHLVRRINQRFPKIFKIV